MVHLLFLLWFEGQYWRTGPKELEHGLGVAEVHLREAATEPIAAVGIGLTPMA